MKGFSWHQSIPRATIEHKGLVIIDMVQESYIGPSLEQNFGRSLDLNGVIELQMKVTIMGFDVGNPKLTGLDIVVNRNRGTSPPQCFELFLQLLQTNHGGIETDTAH